MIGDALIDLERGPVSKDYYRFDFGYIKPLPTKTVGGFSTNVLSSI
jgi:hypothetical protein